MKVVLAGAEPDEADLIVILLHGRGATGEDIIGLGQEFGDKNISWLAPTATNNTWYPASFTERRSRNEPFLSLSIEQVKGLVAQFPAGKVVLGGFSQGACLAADILGRHPGTYAGGMLFSGGLIGDEEELPKTPVDLKGVPISLSGSTQDSHIPHARMERTGQWLKSVGADIETLFYDVPGHQIASEEVELASKVLEKIGV